MSFAGHLKQLRKERGLTQESLAEMLDVSRQAVSKWESETGFPEVDKLILIAKEFNVKLDWLLESELGRTAAVLLGSSETTFYVLAVYFGAAGIRRSRHAAAAALIGDLCGAMAAIFAVKWLF